MKIVITGTVGVGKSTITKELYKLIKSKHENVYFHDELISEVNPYLDNYYENVEEWSYLIQMDYLLNRYKTMYIEQFEQKKNPSRIAIFDRHFIDEYVITSMKTITKGMGTIKYLQYNKTYKFLEKKITEDMKPDYIFLLNASLEEILNRVKTRGRESEKNVDIDYWNEMYDVYYKNKDTRKHFIDSCKKLIDVDANNNNPKEIAKEILKILNI